jgi:hypothetical protein
MICSSASSRFEPHPRFVGAGPGAVVAPQWPSLKGRDGLATAPGRRVAGRTWQQQARITATDSVSAHRFRRDRRSHEPFSEIFFRRDRSRGNRLAISIWWRIGAPTHDMTSQSRQPMVSRNPCAMRFSCIRSDQVRVFDRRRDGCFKPREACRVPPRRQSARPCHCPPFVKWSRCFLHCAVVIGVQCSSIRECTVP